MAEIAAGFAGPAIEVVKWVAEPIKRQFNYLCCFASNIDSLKHKAEELDKATTEVQDKVNIERRNLKDAVPDVITWLDECQKMKEEKETILHEVPNVKEGCLKLGARFSLSRRAKKTVDRMKELLVGKNFNPIARERPLGATQEVPIARERPLGAAQEVPLGKTYDFVSRTKLEEEIMTTLRDVDVNRIGICGMGGLGKTAMAQRIRNRVLKEHVFVEVAMVVVSQQVDKSKIQVEIGESLGLRNLKDDTSEVRAQKLHARLTGTERILLILDDVWEGLELESLGIPSGSKGCTILVTSRNEDALSDMQKVFGIKILSKEEAWFLFRERVGTCVDGAKLNPIAREVVKKCAGLPIALTAVGTTLKDEKDARIWKDALLQLRECCLGIENYDARVYNPIKLSYDFLSSKEAKSLLLLCCLFPEDSRIPLEKLTCICMGLGIFEGIRNLEGARNMISTLTATLTSRSLLFLDSFMNQRCVRMHDVVRDVCAIIAKNEKYIGGNDCAWYSSDELIGERSEFHTELGFPNLRLLLLEKEFKFDSTAFLEGIRDLHVLWIGNSTLTSLPHATQPLKNLQTLVLVSCWELKTISVVGELVNLKILICRYCSSLEELPTEIKRLNRLKLLDLTGCHNLQSIGRGIISSLVGLEELKMLNSFRKWEGDDREGRKNAGLRELQALTNLTCLEIEIEDPTLVAENIHISTKLERFHITFEFDRNYSLREEIDIYDKKMSLCLERETCLGHWIEMQLLRETEYLSLSGNGANKFDFRKSQNIKWLSLSRCDYSSHLFCQPEKVSLGNLKELTTRRNPFSGHKIPVSSFNGLEMLIVSGYQGSTNLISSSIATNLANLKSLRIFECDEMVQVVKDEDKEDKTVLFPKLEELSLHILPKLVSFCELKCDVVFPSLRKLEIRSCPKMKNFSLGLLAAPNLEDFSTDFNHLLELGVKVSFDRLKILRIKDVRNTECPFHHHKLFISLVYALGKLYLSTHQSMSTLFPLSVAGKLVNLRLLQITDCPEMVKLIEEEEEEEEEEVASGSRRNLLFPKLEELKLSNLPKLVSFCERRSGVELPSLSGVGIYDCPNMIHFCSGPLTAPNLKIWVVKKDSNGVLQQRAKEKEEEQEKKKQQKEGGEEAQETRVK